MRTLLRGCCTFAALTFVLALVTTASPIGAQANADDVTVVTTEIAPFIIRDGNDADGFYFDIWEEVASETGLTYELVWADSFADMLSRLEDGSADIAVAPLAPTAEREVRLDFTSAVISSGPQTGQHERVRIDATSLLDAFISWSVVRILAFATLGLVVLAHIIWLAERNDPDRVSDIAPTYVRGVWDSFWWAAVTATTVGYGDTVPRSTRGRVIALFTMLGSLFLVGALVSQTTSVLGEEVERNPVEGVEDLVGQPVGAIAGTSFAAYLQDNGVDVVGYPDNRTMFDAAEAGEIDVVVTNPFTLSDLGPAHGVAAVGEVLFEEFETFGLQQNSPLREPLNQAIADLQSSGEIEAIIKRWLG